MDADAVDHGLAVAAAIIGAEVADHRLDAGIDVGAVEGDDAGFGEGLHVGDRGGAVDGAMAAGELPAAADDARDSVVGREVETLHQGAHSGFGSGTAVVAAWEKRRRPRRLILSRDGQFGSGQAISASLVIQSFGCVGRCLAASSGSTEASRIDRDALSRRQMQHLAAKLEMVADRGAAIELGAGWRDDLDAEVVELEMIVRRAPAIAVPSPAAPCDRGGVMSNGTGGLRPPLPASGLAHACSKCNRFPSPSTASCAVDDVCFAVAKGAIVGLIGPNGAGKTTTFNLIAGTLGPTSGSIRIDGRAVEHRGRASPRSPPASRAPSRSAKPFGEMSVLGKRPRRGAGPGTGERLLAEPPRPAAAVRSA